jgi:hypothetical protein
MIRRGPFCGLMLVAALLCGEWTAPVAEASCGDYLTAHSPAAEKVAGMPHPASPMKARHDLMSKRSESSPCQGPTCGNLPDHVPGPVPVPVLNNPAEQLACLTGNDRLPPMRHVRGQSETSVTLRSSWGGRVERPPRGLAML